MKNTLSRVLIETIVKKAIKDIQDSPERSTRNLVDMALNFSDGRFQKQFFEMAQTMLKNEDSPYYDLIQDTALHVDSERILRFGMNLGYNSCTRGAQRIREIEENENYNIPWLISLKLNSESYPRHEDAYQKVISQGEGLGIYSWMLFCDAHYPEFLPLVREHSESAFALFLSPQNVTGAFLEEASELDNLMLVLHYEETTDGVCALLRESGLLYSIYETYHTGNAGDILSGELFSTLEMLHPVFSILLPDWECPDPVRREIYNFILQARNKQLFQTIPWEATYDTEAVDRIISNDSCVAFFDDNGELCPPLKCAPQERRSLFSHDLSQILKQAFPKCLAP